MKLASGLMPTVAVIGALALPACREDAPRADEKDAPAAIEAPVPNAAPVPSAQPSLVLPAVSLTIVDSAGEKSTPLAVMAEKAKPRVVVSRDPYYKEERRFHALPLSDIVPFLFGEDAGAVKAASYVLVASDGYEVRISGELLMHPAAFLAYSDADHGKFQPIGDQKADPAPFYMVWEGSEFADEKAYPRPWSLVRIRKLAASDAFKHSSPPGGFGSDDKAKKGFESFQKSCVRCHAINQEGGHVGPDLNVPQNILAYRPEEQVRAYIKDPRTFRYSTMPAHAEMSAEELDGVIAYLRLMGQHQHDPGAKEGTPP